VLVSAAADPGWTAAQTATILVPLIALIGLVIAAAVTYWFNQRAARRERRAAAFAAAIGVVERYAELPYRVRRRRDDDEARHKLTEEISEIQSELANHQALLEIECPRVAEKYSALVRAAKIQAGGQMKQAWRQAALQGDDAMNLEVRYPREKIDTARNGCINAMRLALPGNRRRNTPLLPTANSDPIRPAVPPQQSDQIGPATPPR
jgi:hypothetical protein